MPRKIGSTAGTSPQSKRARSSVGNSAGSTSSTSSTSASDARGTVKHVKGWSFPLPFAGSIAQLRSFRDELLQRMPFLRVPAENVDTCVLEYTGDSICPPHMKPRLKVQGRTGAPEGDLVTWLRGNQLLIVTHWGPRTNPLTEKKYGVSFPALVSYVRWIYLFDRYTEQDETPLLHLKARDVIWDREGGPVIRIAKLPMLTSMIPSALRYIWDIAKDHQGLIFNVDTMEKIWRENCQAAVFGNSNDGSSYRMAFLPAAGQWSLCWDEGSRLEDVNVRKLMPNGRPWLHEILDLARGLPRVPVWASQGIRKFDGNIDIPQLRLPAGLVDQLSDDILSTLHQRQLIPKMMQSVLLGGLRNSLRLARLVFEYEGIYLPATYFRPIMACLTQGDHRSHLLKPETADISLISHIPQYLREEHWSPSSGVQNARIPTFYCDLVPRLTDVQEPLPTFPTITISTVESHSRHEFQESYPSACLAGVFYDCEGVDDGDLDIPENASQSDQDASTHRVNQKIEDHSRLFHAKGCSRLGCQSGPSCDFLAQFGTYSPFPEDCDETGQRRMLCLAHAQEALYAMKVFNFSALHWAEYRSTAESVLDAHALVVARHAGLFGYCQGTACGGSVRVTHQQWNSGSIIDHRAGHALFLCDRDMELLKQRVEKQKEAIRAVAAQRRVAVRQLPSEERIIRYKSEQHADPLTPCHDAPRKVQGCYRYAKLPIQDIQGFFNPQGDLICMACLQSYHMELCSLSTCRSSPTIRERVVAGLRTLMPESLAQDHTPAERRRMIAGLTHSVYPGHYIPFSFILSVLFTRNTEERYKINELWHTVQVTRCLAEAGISEVDGFEQET